MQDENKKHDAIIRATKIKKDELLEIGQLKGFVGLYTMGLEHMYDYLIKKTQIQLSVVSGFY